MIETTEIIQTVEHLQRTFEDLILRGLKASGPEQINTLNNIKEECERIGAFHLAERVSAIVDAIQKNDRSGADALMRAQASLRMFERILTLENAKMVLAGGINSFGELPDESDDDDEEDDEA